MCSHRGQVAQAARQTAMSDRLRGVPIAPKVHILKRKVGGNGDFFAFSRSQQRAVVSNPQRDAAASRLRPDSQCGNKTEFAA